MSAPAGSPTRRAGPWVLALALAAAPASSMAGSGPWALGHTDYSL